MTQASLIRNLAGKLSVPSTTMSKSLIMSIAFLLVNLSLNETTLTFGLIPFILSVAEEILGRKNGKCYRATDR
jgi:hypothetical protein